MAPAPLNSAETSFFQALQDDFAKRADVEEDREKLDPNTRLLLGIPERDSEDLPDLEQEASQYDEHLRSPEEADEDQRVVENEEVFASPDEDAQEVPQPAEQHVVGESAPVVDAPPEDEPSPAPAEPELVDEHMEEEELPPAPAPAPQPKPEPPSRDQFGSLFSNRKAHPLVMAEVLKGRYDDNWVTWEPETLWWEIRRDFGPVGELSRNKIMALRVALQTGFPWTDWDVFENCGTAWNDHIPIFGAYQPMPPTEAAFTVSILKKLHPEFELENESVAYLGAICEEHGYVFAPPVWFPGVQKLINRKKWIFSLRDDVKKTWSQVKKMTLEQVEQIDFRTNNPLDIHIGKLIAVREYLGARELERKTQAGRQVRRVAVSTEVASAT